MVNVLDNMSPEEKLGARLEAWLAAEHVQFKNTEARDSYRERVQRLIDVIQLHKPDRVPAAPRMSFFPAIYAGMSLEEAMYDYEKTADAWRNSPLIRAGCGVNASGPGSGKALEYLDYKLFRWPGHGVPSNIPFQCVEAEYMKANEYDELISDPSAFLIRKYLGRICGKLEPLQKMPSLFTSLEFGTFLGALTTLGDPGVQEAYTPDESRKRGCPLGSNYLSFRQ
jgi:hypothetical protein